MLCMMASSVVMYFDPRMMLWVVVVVVPMRMSPSVWYWLRWKVGEISVSFDECVNPSDRLIRAVEL